MSLVEGPLPEFEAADFWCVLDAGSIKFTRTGEMRFSLTVPAEQIDLALPLRFLARDPVPLHCRLDVWEPYTEQVAEDEERMQVVLRGLQ